MDSLWIAFSPKLVAVLSLRPESRPSEDHTVAISPDTGKDTPGKLAPPPTMDLLLEVELAGEHFIR